MVGLVLVPNPQTGWVSPALLWGAAPPPDHHHPVCYNPLPQRKEARPTTAFLVLSLPLNKTPVAACWATCWHAPTLPTTRGNSLAALPTGLIPLLCGVRACHHLADRRTTVLATATQVRTPPLPGALLGPVAVIGP